jgi:hypothetical protein
MTPEYTNQGGIYMKVKAIILTIFASLLFICSSSAASQVFGQGKSQVNHPRGYIGPPIARDPRVPPIAQDDNRFSRRLPQQSTRSYTYRQHRYPQTAWYHGYRNYGQYRRTQVGNRRNRTFYRPSWADRHR